MKPLKEQRSIPVAVGLLLSLLPAAHAATVLTGDLFYSTFQTQGGPAGPNIYKVHFVYDNAPSLTLSSDCNVAALPGADGLIFDPNDSSGKTILVGEQSANLVASIALGANPCSGSVATPVKADGTAPSGKGNGQAYGLAATPDKSHLWMFPNDLVPNPNHINVATLPLSTDGVPHTVTGVDGLGSGPNPTLRAVAFIGNQAYYGDANDNVSDGHMGTLSASFVTARVVVVDDTAGGSTDLNGSLPTHGMEYDTYSGCIIASSGNQIWQICPAGVAGAATDGKFHVRAKISTGATCVPPGNTDPLNKDCNTSNWDQTSVDSAGHLFAANNDGDLLFVDYSANASKLINNNLGGAAPVFQTEVYLRAALDDVINGGGAPPPPLLTLACPASNGVVGVPYSSSLVATGGTLPYSFSIIAGALPGGLGTFPNTTGLITGTPTTAGPFTFTAQVKDAAGATQQTQTTQCTITIGGPPPPLPPPLPPSSLCNPSTLTFGNGGFADTFQVKYISNLNVGDSYVNISNAGTSSTTAFPVQNGNICANVFTFSPDEQLVSCCSCLVTPDALVSLSARNDLINNTLTPGVPTSLVVKLVASAPSATGGPLVGGLTAWGETLHATPVTSATPPGTYAATETPFTRGSLSPAELTRISTLCGFIQTNGSGFGICRSCRFGGLAAVE
jgi:hypothetical protein